VPFAYIPEGDRAPLGLFRDEDIAGQRRFFASRPDLLPTPLRSLPALAHQLGLGALDVKDETSRFGLNAFKAAGATFAISTLRDRGAIHAGDTLVCASEGNHGRAVARAARDAHCTARVYMAGNVAEVRVSAIESEGASVVRVSGTYDDAVRVMARDAAANAWTIISDTSWEGYEEIPRLIMLGYTRLLDEAEASWTSDADRPDVIFVPAGVGGLLAAVASWAHWRYGRKRPRIVAVEPATAACVQSSVRNHKLTVLQGPFNTVLGGLRCGEMSPAAFDASHSLVDAYVAIEDDWAFEAIRLLAAGSGGDPEVRAGASGAASLGGLVATLRDPGLTSVREALGVAHGSRIMILVTEGVTDPTVFDRAVGMGNGRH
jgi:diaminopropionate ammonia-lyase